MMTPQEAAEAARHFIWNRTESYPVYPLDDDGNVDPQAVSNGNYYFNELIALSIDSSEVTSDLDDESYTVTVSGIWVWSENDGEEEEFIFEVYVPKDADPSEENYFDCDLIQ